MATVFEIVEKLRNGEEVIIPSKYSFILMQQMEGHSEKIGALRGINFEPHSKKGMTKLTLLI